MEILRNGFNIFFLNFSNFSAEFECQNFKGISKKQVELDNKMFFVWLFFMSKRFTIIELNTDILKIPQAEFPCFKYFGIFLVAVNRIYI